MHNLDAAKVVKTLEQLRDRIGERFPETGLAGIAAELTESARSTSLRARRIAEPYVLLRAAVCAVVAAAVALGAWLVIHAPLTRLKFGADAAAWTQGLEACVNLLILAGAAVWFLMNVEQRLKRRQALKDLHELRSYAHVIDMHQLTKDPTVVLSKLQRTSSSPAREMTQFQLTRYLEYCTELLAMIGKLGALYSEYTRDPEIVAAVNDVESLATNLGRKIWQKITILSALDESQAR